MKLRVLVATAAIAAALPLGAVGAESACAAEGPRAVLVVNAGDDGGLHRYCVALPAQSVSGIRFLELAHEQHGLTYRLGHGGQAVCMLAGVGPEEGDCFGEYPDFWGYFRGDGSGGWRWSNTGPGSTIVGDGDVDGWSWGRGGSPSSHPKPPRTKFAEVCPAPPPSEARPAPPAERSRTGNGRAETTAVGERDEGRGVTRRTRDEGRDEGMRRRLGSSPRAIQRTPSASPGEESARAAAADDGPSGPPPAGVAALAATVALAAAGAFAARRRRRG
jgi:hypothetical protein